jgi:hypothetical protein
MPRPSHPPLFDHPSNGANYVSTFLKVASVTAVIFHIPQIPNQQDFPELCRCSRV